VVFIIEILVGQAEGITLGGALCLDLCGQGVERQVGGDDLVGGQLAVVGAFGCGKPAAERHARGHCGIGGGILEGCDGGVFLHLLGANDGRSVRVIIGQREVGLEHEGGDIVHGLAIGHDGNGDYAAARVCRIGHGACLSVGRHDVGERVGLRDHRQALGDFYGAGIGAVGILGEDVCGVIGLSVGTECAERGCLAHVHVAIDVELKEISVL